MTTNNTKNEVGCNRCDASLWVYCTQDKFSIRTVHTGKNLEYKTERTIEKCLSEIDEYLQEVLLSQKI